MLLILELLVLSKDATVLKISDGVSITASARLIYNKHLL